MIGKCIEEANKNLPRELQKILSLQFHPSFSPEYHFPPEAFRSRERSGSFSDSIFLTRFSLTGRENNLIKNQ